MLVDERFQVMLGLGDLALDGAHGFLDTEQVGHRAQHLVVQGATGLDAGILGQVTHHRALRQRDAATVCVFEPGDDLEQRRLARAVRRDERRALAGLEHQ